MTLGKLAPPSVEYARSTDATPTLSVAVHVMACAEPTPQLSPPTGDPSVTAGACVSPPAPERVTHCVPLRKMRLSASAPANSDQPLNTVPPDPVPSSAGELS